MRKSDRPQLLLIPSIKHLSLHSPSLSYSPLSLALSPSPRFRGVKTHDVILCSDYICVTSLSSLWLRVNNGKCREMDNENMFKNSQLYLPPSTWQEAEKRSLFPGEYAVPTRICTCRKNVCYLPWPRHAPLCQHLILLHRSSSVNKECIFGVKEMGKTL